VDPVDGGADDNTNWPKTVSSATYVEDVNQRPNHQSKWFDKELASPRVPPLLDCRTQENL
jgi:hypothetical protein